MRKCPPEEKVHFDGSYYNSMDDWFFSPFDVWYLSLMLINLCHMCKLEGTKADGKEEDTVPDRNICLSSTFVR